MSDGKKTYINEGTIKKGNTSPPPAKSRPPAPAGQAPTGRALGGAGVGGRAVTTTNKPGVVRYDNVGCQEEICRVDTMYESDDGDYVLYEDYEALQAECENLRALLLQSAPIIHAHAGASHMLEGFKPKRNKWDALVEQIDAAIATNAKATGEVP